MFGKCIGEDHDEEGEQAHRQNRNLAVRGLADLGLAFADEPAGAKQRVADTQADAAKQGERTEPAEVAANIAAVDDRQSLDQGADGHALHEGGDERSAGKAGVPDPPHPLRLVAELEGDAAQDQPRQHEQQRQIERGEQRGIDDREGAPEHHAGNDQPRFVAVPDRRYRADHAVASRLIAGQAEQDADTQIETVKQNIEQHADGQDAYPEQDHGYSPAGRWRAAGMPSATDMGRFGIAAAGGRIRFPTGPARSSR